MKILILSSHDPKNARSWSGTSLHMYSSLKAISEDVAIFHSGSNYLKLVSKIVKKITRQDTELYKTRLISYFVKNRIKSKIRSFKPDVIVGIVGSLELSTLETDIPVVHISDATYAGLRNYYDTFQSMSSKSQEAAEEIERLALQKADKIILPSKWAVDSAKKYYDIDDTKLVQIPLGTNLPHTEITTKELNSDTSRPYNILFVGVEWIRKGGFTVIRTMEVLRKSHDNFHLTIVGCTPPPEVDIDTKNTTIIPFLDKNSDEDMQKFQEIYQNSTLMLVPTKAEAFGMVFSEAAMYGLPTFSYRTGGLEDVILHEKTGYLLPPEANHSDFADAILKLLAAPQTYQQMSQDAHDYYHSTLNWGHWKNRIKEELSSLIKNG